MAKGDKAKHYDAIITEIFNNNYSEGDEDVRFERQEIADAAETLGLPRPGNLGDVIYHYRFRYPFPTDIVEKVPEGKHWVIRLAGRAKYRFSAVVNPYILPDQGLVVTKVPDATPEIIKETALNDEQAILARVRYNRLIDLFLGVNAYSLQNHLRTSSRDIGQTEIDEIYVAVDHNGAQYIVPVQAKGGRDKIGIVQVEQDVLICAEKFKGLTARPVAAQFLPNKDISLFELAMQDDEIVKVREARYRLVDAGTITPEERALYAQRSGVVLP